MSDSVLERISQNVLETIQNVTTDNGYDYTLTVSRATAINEPRHLRAFIYQISPDDDEKAAPINDEQWKQNYAVTVYVLPDESDSVPTDVYNNAIAAAIHKELMADYSRGGLAINTVIKPTLFFPATDGDYGGITFMFDVVYRHALDNPFNSAN